MNAPTDTAWPALPLSEWQPTYATLHMWLQIVGKTRLALAPMQNHWWQVTLYVTPRGLTTSTIPLHRRAFAVEFDFLAHELVIRTSAGEERVLPLSARSVAEFYRDYVAALAVLGIDVQLLARPVEVVEAVPFAEDEEHRAYDPDAAERCWRILLQTDRLLKRFASRFTGKASPVHFFWGNFDLAYTRFSGRRAPHHSGSAPNCADYVMIEAYTHECSSAGFWPGGGAIDEPAFYAYAYPEPPGYARHTVLPAAAQYNTELREFILPYQIVRSAANPDDMLLEFLQSTYEAAADLGGWDRGALDRPPDEWDGIRA